MRFREYESRNRRQGAKVWGREGILEQCAGPIESRPVVPSMGNQKCWQALGQALLRLPSTGPPSSQAGSIQAPSKGRRAQAPFSQPALGSVSKRSVPQGNVTDDGFSGDGKRAPLLREPWYRQCSLPRLRSLRCLPLTIRARHATSPAQPILLTLRARNTFCRHQLGSRLLLVSCCCFR